MSQRFSAYGVIYHPRAKLFGSFRLLFWFHACVSPSSPPLLHLHARFFLSCFSFFAGDIAKRPASGLRSQSGAKIPPQIRAAAVPTRERLRNKKQRPKREKERERESRARSSFTLFPSTSFVLFANFPGDGWFATPLKRLPPTMRPPKHKKHFRSPGNAIFFRTERKKKEEKNALYACKVLAVRRPENQTNLFLLPFNLFVRNVANNKRNEEGKKEKEDEKPQGFFSTRNSREKKAQQCRKPLERR